MENVWEYPRPPALVPCERRVRVELGGTVIADSTRAYRILETSHPPTIYIPRADFGPDVLRPVSGASLCEYKGVARYWDVVGGTDGGRVAPRAAWDYPEPSPAYGALLDHLSLYPGRMDACFLDDEGVQAQPGDFYGGWITEDLVGPFKGAPGTLGW